MREQIRTTRPSELVWLATLVGSSASLVASLVLSVDALRLATDPGAVLGCDVNAVLSCGTVASSWQAAVLGFPNAFLGLMTEPVVITLAVVALSGGQLPGRVLLAAQAVYTVGLGFAYWLLHQALFDIGAVCPWCLLVTVATTLVWVELLHVNVRGGHLPVSPRVQAGLSTALDLRLDVVGGVVWVLLVVLAVVLRYGERLLA